MDAILTQQSLVDPSVTARARSPDGALAGFHYPVPGTRYPIFDIRYPISAISLAPRYDASVPAELSPPTADVPSVPMLSMDTLWIQVAGTLCNIACTHCFISCSPRNHSHEMMSLGQVLPYLEEARAIGVREYYFTGGEPLMNRDLLAILEATLQQGPATVLTNGMLLRPETCARLRELADGSRYSLDIRVSLDGFDAASHDAIRGSGVWERVMAGLRNLADVDINPVITVTEAAEGIGAADGRTRFLDLIRSMGFPRPRLKVLPLFRIGAE